MKRAMAWLAAAACAGTAFGQTHGLQNGGFEQQCFFCGGPFAEGWHSPGNDTIARTRFVGDGLSPEFFPVGTPGAITPRTGNGVIAIGTHGFGGFEGVTTDTVNFCYCDQMCQTACAPPFPFFDPYFDYEGGDVVVSGWYMIPAESPLVGDAALVSLNVKVNFQNVASIEQGGISGHTGGQWVQFTLTFPRAQIQEQYECNRGIRPNCGCVCVPESPLPDHVKITLGRFTADGNPTSGTIYWDDVTFVQLPPATSCDADVNCDGVPDQGDVACMILAVAGDTSCFCQADPDFNHDGVPDQGDVADIILVVAGAPCP